MKYLHLFSLIIISLLLSNCSNNNTPSDQSSKTEVTMKTEGNIMEVTTFNINSEVNAEDFKNRDLQIENDFTSQQPGFIKRQSGVNEKGEYVVVVFWKTTEDADASMGKFMNDASVADYAQMIKGESMKMARYKMDKTLDANNSAFVEIMSYNVKPETDMEKFKQLNYQVETDFTGKRDGFIQRLTGSNEEGKQVIAVYWLNKELSDASLEPFMKAPISKEFMAEMDQSSIVMGRYNFLK